MLNKLKDMLLLLFVQIGDTKYARNLVVLGIVIPLVVTFYGYLDDVIFNAENAINTIQAQNVSYNGSNFPLGAYFIAYMNVAQIDVCLTTLFGYATAALVWSFTTDLKPAFVKK